MLLFQFENVLVIYNLRISGGSVRLCMYSMLFRVCLVADFRLELLDKQFKFSSYCF